MTEPVPKTVLIVEDNALFRLLLRSLLTSLFPSLVIAEAGDAPEGLAQARCRRPEIVFMDISLPSGNGLALTKELKREIPTVQVIVCTSHDTPEYRSEAARCGASQFVTKQGLGPRQMAALMTPLLGPTLSSERIRPIGDRGTAPVDRIAAPDLHFATTGRTGPPIPRAALRRARDVGSPRGQD